MHAGPKQRALPLHLADHVVQLLLAGLHDLQPQMAKISKSKPHNRNRNIEIAKSQWQTRKSKIAIAQHQNRKCKIAIAIETLISHNRK
eukprot:15432207-Alexandrium_andersonii.AAC.1